MLSFKFRPVRALGTMLVALATTASTQSAATAAEIRLIKPVDEGRSVFLIAGPIVDGDLLRLQTEIAKLPPKRVVSVVLNSPGGSVGEGVKLGLFFHQAKITTAIVADKGVCHSACAIAFLGGRDATTGKPMRIKPSTAQLGVHAFKLAYDTTKKYTKEDMESQIAITQRISFALIEYFREIKEDMAMLPLMLRAPSEKIMLIGNDDALQLGIHVLDVNTKKLIDPAGIHQRVRSAMSQTAQN